MKTSLEAAKTLLGMHYIKRLGEIHSKALRWSKPELRVTDAVSFL
jgi:hypothetical protein